MSAREGETMMHFRTIRTSAVATLALGSMAASALAQTPRSCTPLPDEKIAIQMYSMNGALRDPNPAPAAAGQGGARGGTPPAIVDSVLAGLHAIGYKNAELAGLFGQPIDTVRPLMEKNQIKVVGNHGSFSTDLNVWTQTVADAQALGQNPMIGSAGYGPPGLNGGIENVLATAATSTSSARQPLPKA